MKKVILMLAIGAFAAKTQAQDTTGATGNCELGTVIQVDGKAEEWPMTWVVDDDKIFSYNVCSDNNNIYIRMKTNDDVAKRKIAHFGLTIWMDANGKKKKKLGLRFPTGVEAKERTDLLSKSENERKDMNALQIKDFHKKMDHDMIQDLEVLELIGLADDPLTSTRSGITNGLKVAIASEEDGTYMYEALIPFKSFRLSKASIATLSIGFETGRFNPPTQTAKGGAASVPRGGPGQGGYGGYGGGYGGSSGMSRGMGGSARGSNPMMYTTSAWVFVKLK
jgi:hypothetical protein